MKLTLIQRHTDPGSKSAYLCLKESESACESCYIRASGSVARALQPELVVFDVHLQLALSSSWVLHSTSRASCRQKSAHTFFMAPDLHTQLTLRVTQTYPRLPRPVARRRHAGRDDARARRGRRREHDEEAAAHRHGRRAARAQTRQDHVRARPRHAQAGAERGQGAQRERRGASLFLRIAHSCLLTVDGRGNRPRRGS